MIVGIFKIVFQRCYTTTEPDKAELVKVRSVFNSRLKGIRKNRDSSARFAEIESVSKKHFVERQIFDATEKDVSFALKPLFVPSLSFGLD